MYKTHFCSYTANSGFWFWTKKNIFTNPKENSSLFFQPFLTQLIMLIKSVHGKTPSIPEDCYVAENATIVGDVSFGNSCSVWFNAVIRGDVNSIKIGNKVNIQDGAVIHCTYLKHPTLIGNNVSIGHNAIVHGCTIHDNVLIGMGAIVMDNCVVESNAIIAAGAVVTQNTVVASGSIYAGVPAKKVKDIDQSDFAGEIERISNNYVMYSSWFKEE
jgi:carbonic anhydrase/acetyltransferase-like protein (isoleucine patch superfamily)